MAQQKTHPDDILEVENIDLNCTEIQQEVVRTSKRVQDPETLQFSTIYEEQVYEFNHADFYQVLWDLQPFRLKPGQTRQMKRSVAEHYAKHLANHMLGKEESRTGKLGLIQSNIARPAMLARILKRVVEYYVQGELLTPGEQAAADFDRMNPQEEARAVNVGVVPPTAVGVLTPEPPSLDEVMRQAGTGESTEPSIPQEPAAGQPLPPQTTTDPNPPQTPVTTQPSGSPANPVVSKNPPKGNGKPPRSVEDLKASIFDPKKPAPAREDVIKSAYELGITFNPKDSTDRIIALIKKF